MPGNVSVSRQEPRNLTAYSLPCTEVNNKKKALAICLTTLVLAQFILFVISYSGLRPASIFNDSGNFALQASGLIGGAALGAIVDAVLALSIVVLLYRRRSEIPFSRTSSTIDRIMMYTVGSGLLTAASALASLVTMLTVRDNIVYIVPLVMLPKRESVCCSVIIH